MLDDLGERVEKQSVELTIRNMRTGMRLAMGEALMHQQEADIATWAGGNPVRWLGSPPAGYRGECEGEARQDLPKGEWCFDPRRRELLYRPYNTDHLRAPSSGGEDICSVLRWRVARAPEALISGGFAGLRLETASLCEWLAERQ
ncbi:MAG: hypothetical protein QM739_11380 [Propionivibrio sp.]